MIEKLLNHLRIGDNTVSLKPIRMSMQCTTQSELRGAVNALLPAAYRGAPICSLNDLYLAKHLQLDVDRLSSSRDGVSIAAFGDIFAVALLSLPQLTKTCPPGIMINDSALAATCRWKPSQLERCCRV